MASFGQTARTLCGRRGGSGGGDRRGLGGNARQGAAGQDHPPRRPRGRPAFFLQGRRRRAGRLHGRPLPRGRDRTGRSAQPRRIEGGVRSGHGGEPFRDDRDRQGRPVVRADHRNLVAAREGRLLDPDLRRRREPARQRRRAERSRRAGRQKGRRPRRHDHRDEPARDARQRQDRRRGRSGEDPRGRPQGAGGRVDLGLFRRSGDPRLSRRAKPRTPPNSASPTTICRSSPTRSRCRAATATSAWRWTGRSATSTRPAESRRCSPRPSARRCSRARRSRRCI